MKDVYTIYQVKDKFGKKIKSPFVYAVSPTKKLAKDFISSRRVDLFKMKKSTLDDKEFYHYMNKYSKMRLSREPLHSSIDGVPRTITVVLTSNELFHVLVQSDKVTENIGKCTDANTFVLKDKYLQSLNTLHYFQIMRFGSSLMDEPVLVRNFFKNDLSLEDTEKDIPYDEFNVFTFLYGWCLFDK